MALCYGQKIVGLPDGGDYSRIHFSRDWGAKVLRPTMIQQQVD